MCAEASLRTAAVDETTIIAHGTQVLEDEDGHGTDQQQHDEHHDPDVCAEGLCGRRADSC